MDKKQVQIAIGGLLHDIGKVVYRHNDSRRHCESGYDFIKELGIDDEEILAQIRFHHSRELKNAQIADDSLAYITYWADNVAAGADRRDKDEADTGGSIFEKNAPLSSIFNILNGNNQSFSYPMAEIYDSGEANFPQENAAPYSEITYSRIIEHLKDGIRAVEFKTEYVNSLLGVMEANLSFVPSLTDTKQLLDISLYDHVKLTAAVGSCIYEYLKANGVTDYREALYKNAGQAYRQNAFLMLSLDMSGIQNFIYKVDSSDALKMLRAKSFYLEILLENIIDELLLEAFDYKFFTEKLKLQDLDKIIGGCRKLYPEQADCSKYAGIFMCCCITDGIFDRRETDMIADDIDREHPQLLYDDDCRSLFDDYDWKIPVDRSKNSYRRRRSSYPGDEIIFEGNDMYDYNGEFRDY